MDKNLSILDKLLLCEDLKSFERFGRKAAYAYSPFVWGFGDGLMNSSEGKLVATLISASYFTTNFLEKEKAINFGKDMVVPATATLACYYFGKLTGILAQYCRE